MLKWGYIIINTATSIKFSLVTACPRKKTHSGKLCLIKWFFKMKARICIKLNNQVKYRMGTN